MEIKKGTTSHYGIKLTETLNNGDPVFATVNGSPYYCQVESFDKETNKVTLKDGDTVIGEISKKDLYDIFIDSRHFQQMGFEFGCINNVCFFSTRIEPSLKFVPNDKDSVAALANQLILVTDLTTWEKDNETMTSDEILSTYPTVGSLRFLESLYRDTGAFDDVKSKIVRLLNHLNSL